MDKKEFKEKYELFKRKAYVIIYGTNTRLGKLFRPPTTRLISIYGVGDNYLLYNGVYIAYY